MSHHLQLTWLCPHAERPGEQAAPDQASRLLADAGLQLQQASDSLSLEPGSLMAAAFRASFQVQIEP